MTGGGRMTEKLGIARKFIEAIPYAEALGIGLTDLSDGRAEMVLPFNPVLVGDPAKGVIHGGAISAVMDTCCGAAVMAHETVPRGTATIDLRIDYMRAAQPGQDITVRAECYHVTRSVAFVRATAIDEDSEHPVATATGAFTVERG